MTWTPISRKLYQLINPFVLVLRALAGMDTSRGLFIGLERTTNKHTSQHTTQ